MKQDYLTALALRTTKENTAKRVHLDMTTTTPIVLLKLTHVIHSIVMPLEHVRSMKQDYLTALVSPIISGNTVKLVLMVITTSLLALPVLSVNQPVNTGHATPSRPSARVLRISLAMRATSAHPIMEERTVTNVPRITRAINATRALLAEVRR
jgi:hypothetical protein